MLSKPVFYHGTIRKIVVTFGSIFDDITINRMDGASVIQNVKVPLSYGSKEKYYSKVTQDPLAGSDDQASVGLVLPRMSFEITNLQYDPSRKLTSRQRNVKPSTVDNTSHDFDYQAVPYNIMISLYVLCDHMEDGLRIIEQILPYFKPDYTATVVDIPELDIKKDITIQLEDVMPNDEYIGLAEDKSRIITWTFNFVAKAFIYPPTENEKIVLDPTISMYDDTGRPGSVEINLDLDPTSAQPTDDYDITVNTTVNEY